MADNETMMKPHIACTGSSDAMPPILETIQRQRDLDSAQEKDLINQEQHVSARRYADLEASWEKSVRSTIAEAGNTSDSTRLQHQASSSAYKKGGAGSPHQPNFSPQMNTDGGHSPALARPSSAHSSVYSIASTHPYTPGNGSQPLHYNQNAEAFFNHSFAPAQANNGGPFGFHQGQQFSPYGAKIPYSSDGIRFNPKLILARRNSPGPSTVPSPAPSLSPSPQDTSSSGSPSGNRPRDVSYIIRGFDDGTGNLFAICRAVPYLLGPKSMLDALASMRNAEVPNEAFLNNEGKLILDPKKLSFMDKALLFTIFLLQISLEDHEESTRQLLSRFDHNKDALVVYKDMGTNNPPACTSIKVCDWVNMAVEWQSIGNPGNVAPDRPDAVTPWEKIMPHLQDRNILNKYLTKSLYEQWIMIPEAYIPLQLNEFVRSGEYERLVQNQTSRESSHRATSRLGFYGNAIHYTPPSPSNRLEWGAKRFSHDHPCGKLVDYRDERHDNALLPEDSAEEHDAGAAKPGEDEEKLQTAVRPRVGWRTKAWRKWVVRYAVIALILGGIIAGIVCAVYFHLIKHQPGDGMQSTSGGG